MLFFKMKSWQYRMHCFILQWQRDLKCGFSGSQQDIILHCTSQSNDITIKSVLLLIFDMSRTLITTSVLPLTRYYMQNKHLNKQQIIKMFKLSFKGLKYLKIDGNILLLDHWDQKISSWLGDLWNKDKNTFLCDDFMADFVCGQFLSIKVLKGCKI